MQLRAGVTLSLTFLGIVFLVAATASVAEARLIMGLGCFLLAAVYAQITKPRIR